MPSRSAIVASRIRWSGAVAAVAALTALLAIGPPGGARAAAATSTGYDQITGAGTTASKLTVPWTSGLLDSSNQPITAANADRASASPTSPLSFMYAGFKNLQVTVSQTQDITHQGVTVSWTGGVPTVNTDGVQADFLQIMECYGDASTGPSPQGCEFGAPGFLTGATNQQVGTRAGDLCALGPDGNPLPPNTSTPPSAQNGDGPILGCDSQEPVAGASPADIDPANPQQYTIPFVPASDPSSPAYSQTDLSQWFNEFNSNEVQEAVTDQNGNGQLQFETLTTTEAPGLGCGGQESNGQVRNCWLVIVPRGEYEPNGFKVIGGVGAGSFLYSSPLSASNWAMRIQIHLSYSPVGSFCPIGTQEIQAIGTQIAARAVQSWQLALNQTANCSEVFGYSAVPESTSTTQLSANATGLAFTTIPIGSEASRPGGGGVTPTLPHILYAPVAVSAVGFGFNINLGTGAITTPIKLTPELLAKALTQVYRTDLPDYYPTGPVVLGPAWSQANPLNITKDSQFVKLNAVPGTAGVNSLAPLLTEDHSGINQQIWQWIQADSAASAWLNQGTTDATNSVAADPDYTALGLGTPPAIDSFPRAYTGVLNLGQAAGGKPEIRHSLDLLPYVNSYDEAASDILTAQTTATSVWNPGATAPDGTPGWWQKVGAEPLGQIFIWGISDTPDLAAYGLIAGQLCDDSGASCVAPSTASITAALASATPDSAGLLHVNPASPGAGGYPLVQVTYAAVDTGMPAADLTAYANLIAYAAGAGQTPGVAPGNLPPGYLPLTASLQAQASAVVATLRADASGSASTSPSSTATPSTSGTVASLRSLTPSASSTTPSVGLSIKPPSAEEAAARTQRQPVGSVRWLLLGVVVAGAACAVGGTALRSAGLVQWLQRVRS